VDVVRPAGEADREEVDADGDCVPFARWFMVDGDGVFWVDLNDEVLLLVRSGEVKALTRPWVFNEEMDAVLVGLSRPPTISESSLNCCGGSVEKETVRVGESCSWSNLLLLLL